MVYKIYRVKVYEIKNDVEVLIKLQTNLFTKTICITICNYQNMPSLMIIHFLDHIKIENIRP